LREKFDRISCHLHQVKKIYELVVAAGKLVMVEGRFVLAINDHVPPLIDREGNKAMQIVNGVYNQIGMHPFPQIPETDGKYVPDEKWVLFR